MTQSGESSKTKKTGTGLSTRILIGLLLGVACGLFFGERCAPLEVVGDAFIGLLQMTVLPYIVISLIVNIGRLSLDRGRRLIFNAVLVELLLLIIGIIAVVVVPACFPVFKSASFFSTSLVEPAPKLNFLGLYIPSNPFGALANNVVPATVLFCILLGTALIGIHGKEGLLHNLDVLADALNKVNGMVVRLTPYGLFAIGAATAGTMTLSEIGRLQAYLITYTAVVAVLTFWVLPMLVTGCTPFRYRDIFGVSKETLITIFATGKIIVVLPQLIDNVKELFRRAEHGGDEVDSSVELLMPLAYPFPNVGTLAILMFVPFAAWYLGRLLSFGDWMVFLGAGALSSFVAPVIGIPFLLDVLRIPADMFHLFVVSTAYTDRIRVVLGAMHLMVLTIVVTAALTGRLKVRVAAMARAAAVAGVVTVACVVTIRGVLGFSFEGAYTADKALVQMHTMMRSRPTRIFNDRLPEPIAPDPSRSRIEAAKERGFLRVGYFPDHLPFAFVNSDGRVVGFDIEMAQELAFDLGVDLHVVRIDPSRAVELLGDGTVDVVMSGIVVDPEMTFVAGLTIPYMEQTMAFVVPDHRVKEFSTREAVRRHRDLKLGVVQLQSQWVARVKEYVPGAEVDVLSSPRPYFRGERDDLDALVFQAEAGSAWTLLYPSYAVVIPQPDAARVPMAFAVPAGDRGSLEYMNSWIEVKRRSRVIHEYYDYWILGRGAEQSGPRWSIIRDVLHWVD